MTDEALLGGSMWEQEMFALLRDHVQKEQGLLEEYRKAAEDTQSKAFAYLVRLLMEDEQRHHRLFEQLAESLKTMAQFNPEDPPIPRMDFSKAERAVLLRTTDQLLRNEEDDSRELKRLQRELHDLKDTTLWGLIVELMQRDTDKHIAILRFAKKHGAEELWR